MVNLTQKPFLMKHFLYEYTDHPAYPNNYRDLLNNNEFMSILMSTKNGFMGKISMTKFCLEKAIELKQFVQYHIDNEL